MAIQVSGTTVINNSKELVGITGADTTTKNALVAAGIGAPVSFTWPNWGSPDQTLTSTSQTSWSKPSGWADSDYLFIYMVGGGGSGDSSSSGSAGGAGGKARIIFTKVGEFAGENYKVGAGRTAGNGTSPTDTYIYLNGTQYTTGAASKNQFIVTAGIGQDTDATGALLTVDGGQMTSDLDVAGSPPTGWSGEISTHANQWISAGGNNAGGNNPENGIFGGGGGGGFYSGSYRVGGGSYYSGRGANSSSGAQVPGGGGSGYYNRNGANGNIRLYRVT